MGTDAGAVAFYAYIIPFLISTVVGSVAAGLVLMGLKRSTAFEHMQYLLDK